MLRSVRGNPWVLAAMAVAVCLSLPTGSAFAAGAADDHTVLILSTTVTGGLTSQEATRAVALGFTVELADATQWAAKSTADFGTYRALIIGDPNCVVGTAAFAPLEANKATWSAAVDGNIIVIGTDPTFHVNVGTVGAGTLITNGISFAANIVGQTGLFAGLGCAYDGAVSQPISYLSQFGTFTVVDAPGCFNNAHIVAVHPALAGLNDAALSNWSCSVHEIITAFPAGFVPLAIARNVTGTGSLTFADGSLGVPYILASGAAVQPVGLNILKSGPPTANVGDDITYTITYGNTGGTNASNVVITDPVPPGTTFVSATAGGTNIAGVVTWNIGTVNAGVVGQTVQFTVHVTAGPTIVNTNYQIVATGVTAVIGPNVTTTVGGVAPTATPTNTPVVERVTGIPTLDTRSLTLMALVLAAAGMLLAKRLVR